LRLSPYELLVIGVICLCLVGVMAAIVVVLVWNSRKKEKEASYLTTSTE
jgi:hypothetical protein